MAFSFMKKILIIICLLVIGSSNAFAGSMEEVLFNAIINNNVDMAKTAISNGADVNSVQNGLTPLGSAILNQNPALVDYLINMGADVNATFINGSLRVTPLATAAYKHEFRAPQYGNQKQLNNDIKIFQRLINAGADVNAAVENTGQQRSMYIAAVRSDGDTPLILAISPDHILGAGGSCLPMVKILISKNVDVNQANQYGLTPLMVCADLLNNHYPWEIQRRLEIAKILISAGADPARVNLDGKTALQYAIKNNFTEMINLLLPISPK